MANKVRFGVSHVYIGTYTDNNGTVTLGEPVAVPGAVRFTMDESAEKEVFWADNVAYYTYFSDEAISAELECALFDDAFKLAFLNYVQLDDGGIAMIKGMDTKKVYMMFQGEGDEESRRGIIYNITPGRINREYSTTEGSKEPQTATLSMNIDGDNNTGITRVGYPKNSSGYSSLFTTPPVPALPSAS